MGDEDSQAKMEDMEGKALHLSSMGHARPTPGIAVSKNHRFSSVYQLPELEHQAC